MPDTKPQDETSVAVGDLTDSHKVRIFKEISPGVFDDFQTTFEAVKEHAASAIDTRITNLEDHEKKYYYYSPAIASTSGSVSAPPSSTILPSETAQLVSLFVHKIINGEATEETALDTNNDVLFATGFLADGSYTLSGVPADPSNTALKFYFRLKDKDRDELDLSKVLDEEPIDAVIYGYLNGANSPDNGIGYDGQLFIDKYYWNIFIKDGGGWLLYHSALLAVENTGSLSSTVGVDGQYALLENGHIYRKVTGAWVAIFAPVLDSAPTDGSTNAPESNGVFDALALKVPTSRTVNGFALSSNVSINLDSVTSVSGDTANPIQVASSTSYLDANNEAKYSHNQIEFKKAGTVHLLAFPEHHGTLAIVPKEETLDMTNGQDYDSGTETLTIPVAKRSYTFFKLQNNTGVSIRKIVGLSINKDYTFFCANGIDQMFRTYVLTGVTGADDIICTLGAYNSNPSGGVDFTVVGRTDGTDSIVIQKNGIYNSVVLFNQIVLS